MRVLVCPQEFKGSLTAAEAARAIAAGVRVALPDAEVIEHPLADGGPGTVAIVSAATGGTLVTTEVRGPLGDTVTATYALILRAGRAPLAIIEAAAAAGLLLVPPAQRDPVHASTFGVGQQLRVALLAGASDVIVGVGGTGTNDGGAGAAQALGYALVDAHGAALPAGPLALPDLDHIGAAAAEPLLATARIRVAVDVHNPLLGPEGATAVYGLQKGVLPAEQAQFEHALEQWADLLARDLGAEVAELAGGRCGWGPRGGAGRHHWRQNRERRGAGG